MSHEYKEDNKKSILTVSIEATDLDAFQKFAQLYKELLYDKRIDEGIRNEYKSKLNDWLSKIEHIND